MTKYFFFLALKRLLLLYFIQYFVQYFLKVERRCNEVKKILDICYAKLAELPTSSYNCSR